MTAMWPAGPPKFSAAMRAHVQNASRKLTPCAGVQAGNRAAGAAVVPLTSGSGFLTGPVVRFPGGITAPAIERIVKRHGRIELDKVLFVHARIAE